MTIPDHVITEIKARVDIVGLVQQHLQLKKSGANYFACCPFHNEKTPSFSVSATKQIYHCFGCGAQGDQIDWVVNYLGVPWNEAVARLAEASGIPLPDNDDGGRIKAKAAVSKALDKAAKWMHGQLAANQHASHYVFVTRKVSGRAANEFLIGYAPKLLQDYLVEFNQDELQALVQAGVLAVGENQRMYPKLGGRIIFPLRDAAGWVIGFSGRLLADGPNKYVNSPDSPFFSKRKEIFRAPDVRHEARLANRLVVTEGYFDVVTLYEAGVGYAVAGMGTATTAENLESMFALAAEVVFCFDGDQAGRQAAWKALLASMPVVGDNRLASFAFLPKGVDPDEFIKARGADEFVRLLDDAVPLSKFFIETYRRKAELEPLEKHSALMGQAAKEIAAVKDTILRMGLAGSISRVFNASVAEVQRAGGWISHAAQKRTALPVMRVDAVESAFLANLLRRPWEAACLPDDVDLALAGGTEIVAMLKAAGLQDEPGAVNRLFAESPFLPMVERLLASGELDEDLPRLAKRIEAAWVGRRLDAMRSNEKVDRELLKQLVSRRFTVLMEIEKCNTL